MYGQLYHRTISRELQEPRRSPRGAGGGARVGQQEARWVRGGCEGMGSARAAGRTRWQRPAHAASGPGPGHKAQSPFGQFAGPRPAPRCRERSGSTGNIFAPCMISGSSTRKGALDGKIRAPCILNHPIVPGNGRIGRGSCHLDLEKHAFRADIAREGAFFAHSAKKGCIRRDSCQPGPRCRRNARDGDAGGVRWAQCGWGARLCRRDARGRGAGTRLARGGDAGRTIRPNAQALPQRAPSELR